MLTHFEMANKQSYFKCKYFMDKNVTLSQIQVTAQKCSL